MDETKYWEYRVETFGGSFRGTKDEDITAILNEWGQEGWEVVATVTVESTYKVRVFAKRPTTQSRRPRPLPTL